MRVGVCADVLGDGKPRVESGGSSVTRYTHWAESLYKNELMTGWVYDATNLPLSKLTINSLKDLGYSVSVCLFTEMLRL